MEENKNLKESTRRESDENFRALKIALDKIQALEIKQIEIEAAD